jgi:hypothetical protein
MRSIIAAAAILAASHAYANPTLNWGIVNGGGPLTQDQIDLFYINNAECANIATRLAGTIEVETGKFWQPRERHFNAANADHLHSVCMRSKGYVAH